MIELTLNTFKKDNFVFIDKESGFAVTRLNLKGVVSCITPSLQRAIDSETLIVTKDFRKDDKNNIAKEFKDVLTDVDTNTTELDEVVEKEVKATKRKPRTKK